MVRNFRRRNRKRLKATLVLSNQSMNARKQENVIIALYRFLSLLLLHFFPSHLLVKILRDHIADDYSHTHEHT